MQFDQSVWNDETKIKLENYLADNSHLSHLERIQLVRAFYKQLKLDFTQGTDYKSITPQPSFAEVEVYLDSLFKEDAECQFQAILSQYHKIINTLPIRGGGTVYICQDQNQSTFAIKRVKSEQNIPGAVREAWFYRWGNKDNHPCTIPMLGAQRLYSSFVMITPAVTTDLQRYLNTLPEKITAPLLRQVFSQLVHIVDYFHNHLGVAHRDLKPSNVFLNASPVDRGFNVILADFDVSTTRSMCPNLNKQHITCQNFKSAQRMNIAVEQTLKQCPSSDVALPEFTIEWKIYQQLAAQQQQRTAQPLPNDICNFVYGFVVRGPDGNDEKSYLYGIDYNPQVQTIEIADLVAFQQHFETHYSSDFLQFANQQDTTLQVILHDALSESYSSLTHDLSKFSPVKSHTYVGTLTHMSPEIAICSSLRRPYDPYPADIFALGVILFQLLFGTYLYPSHQSEDFKLYHRVATSKQNDLNKHPISHFVSRCDRIPKTARGVPLALRDISLFDLLDSMMVFDPSNRPTIKQVLEHLDKVDWDLQLGPDHIR